MAVMYGADADELERLASEFTKAADEIDGESRLLSGILNNISWLGDAAGRFLSDWTGVQRPRIGLSTQFLRDNAGELQRQATEQRNASSARGGGAGVHGSLVSRLTPAQQLEARFEANEQAMRDYLDTLAPDHPLRRAVLQRLAQGYRIYHFDSARGYLTWASGNLATATNVVVTVPGTGTTMDGLTRGMSEVNGRYMNSSGDTATLTTLAWDPPNGSNTLFALADNVNLNAREQTLIDGPLGDFLIELDGMGKNIVVTGHSAGGAAVQTLFARRPELIQHVAGVALLAPAEIHADFGRLMGDTPVLYAIHSDDPINLVHNDPADLVGRIANEHDPGTDVIYRGSRRGVFENVANAHDEWRYAENYRNEILRMFPGGERLDNGMIRQQYVNEDGTMVYIDVPEF
ncbi:MAG TPA: hypothetical protein VNQ73_18200 [Ilumatobacter sp.]|nr:hypothetical protein [Ilumatobacter sp.]